MKYINFVQITKNNLEKGYMFVKDEHGRSIFCHKSKINDQIILWSKQGIDLGGSDWAICVYEDQEDGRYRAIYLGLQKTKNTIFRRIKYLLNTDDPIDWENSPLVKEFNERRSNGAISDLMNY